MTPGEYIEDLGWVGDDVWHAHCVKLNKDEIELFSRTELVLLIALALI